MADLASSILAALRGHLHDKCQVLRLLPASLPLTDVRTATLQVTTPTRTSLHGLQRTGQSARSEGMLLC